MMRGRHQRSLERRPEDCCLAPFWQPIYRSRKLANTSGDQQFPPVDVDLEAGSCSDWNLFRPVVAVVEIREEGVVPPPNHASVDEGGIYTLQQLALRMIQSHSTSGNLPQNALEFT